MTSQLNVDIIADKAGTGPVGLNKQHAAKGWIHIPDGAGSINDSFNISSLDDDGGGDHGIHYTNSMGSANYSITGGIGDDGHATIVMNVDITEGTQAAGSVDFEFVYTNASYNRENFDAIGYLTIHGDLA